MSNKDKPLNLSLSDLLEEEEMLADKPQRSLKKPPHKANVKTSNKTRGLSMTALERALRNLDKSISTKLTPPAKSMESPYDVLLEPASKKNTITSKSVSNRSRKHSQVVSARKRKQKPNPVNKKSVTNRKIDSVLERELREEFERVMPRLLEESLDQLIEVLPLILTDKIIVHMTDHLLKHKEQIIADALNK